MHHESTLSIQTSIIWKIFVSRVRFVSELSRNIHRTRHDEWQKPKKSVWETSALYLNSILGFFFHLLWGKHDFKAPKKKGINLLRQITVQCSTAIIIVYLCNYASKAAHTVITENELCKWESGDVRGGFTKADWGVFKDVKENTHNTHFVWRWIILSRFSVCATALSSSREINKSGFLFAFRAIASGEKLLQRANTITGEQNMPLKSEYH